MKHIPLYFVLALLFSGCLGTKKVTESKKETKTVENTVAKKDSVKTVETNAKIDDAIVTVVPETNPELDAKIDDILSKLNTKKRSGSNNYSFYYDRLKRELTAEFEVGETQNSNVVTNDSTVVEKTFEEKTDDYIYKKITALPWWAYLVVAYLLRSQLIGLVGFFMPGVRNIKSIKGFTKKPDS